MWCDVSSGLYRPETHAPLVRGMTLQNPSIFDRGPLELGVIDAFTGVGTVIAAVWVAGIVSRPRVWEICIVVSISFGLAVIMLGLAPTFLAAVAVIAVLGAAEQGAFSLSMSLGMTYSHHAYDGLAPSFPTPPGYDV